VISVELLAKIRRWHLRDRISIREIARRTSLSKNTVKSYLRSGAVTPAYTRKRMPHKLDPFAQALREWRIRPKIRTLVNPCDPD